MEKSSFDCIRTGSGRTGAIMAWKAGSDYDGEVKGLVDKEGPQRARRAD